MAGLAVSWSLLVAAGAAGGGAATLARALFHPRSELFGPIAWRGDVESSNTIALTFDDGPWPGSTDIILDRLAEARALATFFVIGRYVR